MVDQKTLLFLDDIRNPFLNNYEPILRNLGVLDYKVVWVLNYDELVQWICEKGLPDFITFDHDLADEHYTPPKYWNDYKASMVYQDKKSPDYKEKTGLDCAQFVIDYCIEYKKKLPQYYSHSANPVGRDNIMKLMANYMVKENLSL